MNAVTTDQTLQCYDLLPVQQQKIPQFVPIGSGAVAAGRQQEILHTEISYIDQILTLNPDI